MAFLGALPGLRVGFCSTCSNSALDGGFCPVQSRFGGFWGHKILKTGFPGLSKVDTRWYTAPATLGIRQGLPSQEASGRDRSAPKGVAQIVSAVFEKARIVYRGVEQPGS